MEKTSLGRQIYYNHILLGYVHHSGNTTSFRPALSESETVDFLCELGEINPGVVIHLRSQATDLHRLAISHGLKRKDYLTCSTLMLYIAKLGCRNLTQLHDRDRLAWRLIRGAHLEERVAELLQPA